MATGIKDKVAIIGMGCSRFGERWDTGAEGLMVEAFEECCQDADLGRDDIEAAWLSTCFDEGSVGKSALPLAQTLRLPFIPVTRTENYCASGTEAFRGAVYAVASGACDVALAMGVEKLKDTGYGGLPDFATWAGVLNSLWYPNLSAPGAFAQLAGAYAAKWNIPIDELKQAMAHISVKSHANAIQNEKAHLHREISIDKVLSAPMVASPLGLYDCCGVSDGAACALVTSVEKAQSLGKKDLVSVKSLQLALSSGEEMGFDEWDGDHFMTTEICSRRAYQEAGITNPREQISLMELHDCFSITELVTYEDLHISEPGRAVHDVLDGFYDHDGKIPAQIDGGLKCFGHPVGASGLRMLYEVYLQLQHRAGPRQLPDPTLGLTHNLGGFPFKNVCSIAILGKL